MTRDFSSPAETASFDLDALFVSNPARLAHMRDVAGFAHDFGSCFGLSGQDRALLERAALFHDIGYAPALHCFNFHPLDGAVFLSGQREHPWVIEGVLRHSQAERKAPALPGVAEEYARRTPLADAAWLVRAVTIADWRAAGIGGRTSFAQRLRDIVDRNPDKPAKCERAGRMVVEVRDWFLDWASAMDPERPLPWVFSDIDNTLITPGETLSEANRQAVRSYVDAGGRFSMTSGKHARSVMRLARDMGLNTPQGAANGTCLVEGDRITVVAHLADAAASLVTRLESLGLPLALYRADNIQSGRWWTDGMSDLFERYGELRPESMGSGPVLKILCVAEEGRAEIDAEARRAAEEHGVICSRSDRHFLELVPQGGDKGAAVRAATMAGNWPLLHTVALGDNENDAPMFALCGACAAVANAQDSTRLGADWIVPACAADGVAWMLDRLRQGGWRALHALRTE